MVRPAQQDTVYLRRMTTTALATPYFSQVEYIT